MLNKKSIEFGLLIFSITTIIYCTSFAYIIAKIDTEYKQEIKLLKQKCNLIKK